MNKRFLQLEGLEGRKLLAGDMASPLDYAALIEDIAMLQPSYEELQIQSELASAFAWSNNPAISVSDRIVAVDKSSLYVIDPTQDSSDIPPTLTFDKPISHVLKVDDDRFMVATTSVPDSLPLRVGTSLYLLSMSGGGGIEVVDEMDSVASLSSLLTMERGLVLADWSLTEQFAGASDEFVDADVKLTGSSQLWQKSGLDFFNLSNDRLETDLRLEVTGSVSAQYAGNGLVIANSENGLDVIDVSSGVKQQIPQAGFDRVLSIVSASSSDPSELSAVIKTASHNVLVRISRDGEVLASETLGYEAGMPIVAGVPLKYQHGLLKSLYGNGVTSTVTAYPIDNSDDLGIVTEGDDGLEIQRLPLPFERTGFRPAFAVGDDSIIAIRTDISALERSGYTASSDSIEYHAYLLRRRGNGQFAITDRIKLSSFDYNASAIVSPGTVTLRSMDGRMPGDDAVVLRVDGDHLISQTYGNVGGEVTGFSKGLVTASSEGISYHQWATSQINDSVFTSNDLQFDVSGDGQSVRIGCLARH